MSVVVTAILSILNSLTKSFGRVRWIECTRIFLNTGKPKRSVKLMEMTQISSLHLQERRINQKEKMKKTTEKEVAIGEIKIEEGIETRIEADVMIIEEIGTGIVILKKRRMNVEKENEAEVVIKTDTEMINIGAIGIRIVTENVKIVEKKSRSL